MNANLKGIDAYICEFPEEVRVILEQIRSTILEAAPKATEAIKYGMPTFVFNGNLVHFAAFKIILVSIQLHQELNLLIRNCPFTNRVKDQFSSQLINQSL